jgi:hypothetical protein
MRVAKRINSGILLWWINTPRHITRLIRLGRQQVRQRQQHWHTAAAAAAAAGSSGSRILLLLLLLLLQASPSIEAYRCNGSRD